MTELAVINQLQVAFQTDKKTTIAVDDLNFTLKPGETLALLGESGCGKSLTALALMRLLPNHSVYGVASEILMNDKRPLRKLADVREVRGETARRTGVYTPVHEDSSTVLTKKFSTSVEFPKRSSDLLNLPEYMMRQLRGRRIAIIFQEPMTALNPVLRIGDQLAEVLNREGKFSSTELKAQLIALLTKVEIPEPAVRLLQYPHQLSGGQKQRIVIAMALANNPEILIADEPTTALDVTIQGQILALLKKLQQEHNMSMLLITHDLGVVKAAADRVCVMYAGQLVEEAAVDEFFQQVKHPYSQKLLASLPEFKKRNTRLEAISGSVPPLDAMPTGCRFHPRCSHVIAPCTTTVPQLQAIDKRSVRCHLYPAEDHLPVLNNSEQVWPVRSQSDELLFSVNNLCVHFKVGRSLLKRNTSFIKAVDGLSFQLYKGRTLALVGESGCGKTTASRALLLLQAKTAGDIEYRGHAIDQFKGAALRDYRKQVQIIFQDPYSSMNPRLTVGEIIAEGMLAQGLKRAVIERRQLKLLEQVSLPANSLNRYPHQFSGGQRQRICIARALATEPTVLVCDEPTSALDVSVQAQILNLLKELQIELGMSYLFITHNMAVVSYLADDVLVMQHGRAIEAGRAEQILQNPQQAYTQELLKSVLHV